jgi:hypothetical protein
VKALARVVNAVRSTNGDRIKAYMETRSYRGARGVYVWRPNSHHGVTLRMLGFGVANSLNRYGVLQLVSGQ